MRRAAGVGLVSVLSRTEVPMERPETATPLAFLSGDLTVLFRRSTSAPSWLRTENRVGKLHNSQFGPMSAFGT